MYVDGVCVYVCVLARTHGHARPQCRTFAQGRQRSTRRAPCRSKVLKIQVAFKQPHLSTDLTRLLQDAGISQVRGARRLLARPPALATQKPTVALPGAFHRHPPHPQPRSRSSRSSPAPAPARRPTEASAASRRDPWARADADWTPREEPPDEGQHAPTAPRNAPSARRHREQPAEQAGLGRGYSNAPARRSPSGPAAGEQCSIGSPGTQPGWSWQLLPTTRHRGVASHVS